MEKIYNEYYIDTVLIKGYIHYKDCSPVTGAILILEKIPPPFTHSEIPEQPNEPIYLAHTITNRNGEYCFFITDKMSYYKIKVFDNSYR